MVNIGEETPSSKFVFWVKIEAIKYLVLNISFKNCIDVQGFVYLFGVCVNRVLYFIWIGFLPEKR